MPGPIAGTVRATVLDVQRTTIHGDEYLDLLVQTAEQVPNNEASRVRVPVHACTMSTLTLGDVVAIEFLMGQVTRVTPSPHP